MQQYLKFHSYQGRYTYTRVPVSFPIPEYVYNKYISQAERHNGEDHLILGPCLQYRKREDFRQPLFKPVYTLELIEQVAKCKLFVTLPQSERMSTKFDNFSTI